MADSTPIVKGVAENFSAMYGSRGRIKPKPIKSINTMRKMVRSFELLGFFDITGLY